MRDEVVELMDESDYFPALEASYSLLTVQHYIQAMKYLFSQPENTWLNVKNNWLDQLGLDFHQLFKDELLTFDITFDDLKDISVMWSVPPDNQHDGMYLVMFFNAQNYQVYYCLYNVQYMNEHE